VTNQVPSIKDEDLRTLKEDLLRIRSLTDGFRLAGIHSNPDALAGKKDEISNLWEDIEGLDVYLWKIDPQNALFIRAFVESANAAMNAASAMYSRWERLSAHLSTEFRDEGHKKLIEKHAANSRRRFTDLSREAREAAHIAHFLLNRPEGPNVKQPA
jgi:hypothetical protein